MNTKLVNKIIARDGKNGCLHCLYCDELVSTGENMSIDHLDNNRKNNLLENCIICHKKCNRNKHTDYDMQIKAHEKKALNATYIEPQTRSPAINQNVENSLVLYNFVENYLFDRLDPSVSTPTLELDFDDTINDISFLCLHKYKYGQKPTMIRHLEIACAMSSNYKIVKDGKTAKVMLR